MRSGVEGRADANLRFEKLGDWAASFGGLHGGVKLCFVRAGDRCDEIEMALGNRESFADFIKRDGGSGFQLLRGHSSAAELCGERHSETSRVCRSKKLFGVRADAILKARAERILRLLQDAAIRGNRAFAVFQSALPDCRC